MAISKLISALAFTTMILPAGAYAAQTDADTRVVMVSTRELDATKPADQAVLRHRIAVAAHKACDQVTQGDPLISGAYAECFDEATAIGRLQLAKRVTAADSAIVLR